MNLSCTTPNCTHQFDNIDDWDRIGEIVKCPLCEKQFEISYDEYWCEEMEYEDSMWWLEPIV